jgi:shikimate kinase
MSQKFEDVLLTGSKLWQKMKEKGKTPKIFLIGLRGSLTGSVAEALAQGMAYLQPSDGTLMMHRKSFVKYPETAFKHVNSDEVVESKCYGIKDANGKAMGPVAVFKEDEEKYREMETDVLREFLEESIDGPAAMAVGDTALNKPENLEIMKQGLVIHLRITPETSWQQMRGRRAVFGVGASAMQVKEPVWFEAQGWDNKDLEDSEVREEYFRIGNELVEDYDKNADMIYEMRNSDFENFFWAAEKIFNEIGKHLGVMEETSSEDGTDGDLERELSTFLEDSKLLKYLPTALEWCEEQGAASMEDLVDSPDDFADGLGLKPLERKRLMKGLVALR